MSAAEIAALRAKIFPTRIRSLVNRYLNYYPPDIALLRLSNQDPQLKSLNLVDVRQAYLEKREEFHEAMGRNIRVSVKDGMRKKVEEVKVKGKKRK